VCSEHAADSSESRSSLDVVMGKMVSWGENRSATALKWTDERARECQIWPTRSEYERKFLTLYQPRAILRHILDQYAPPPIP